MAVTTVGTILINEALPEDMRKEQYVLDKDGTHKLFTELAEKHPEQYRQVLKQLAAVGRTAVWTEGASVSLSGLLPPKQRDELLAPVRAKIQTIVEDDSLSDQQKREQIADAALPLASQMSKTILKASEDEDSPYAMQIRSGARGKASDLSSLRGADILVTDQNDKFLPVFIDRSYAEGYTPLQYFAASYGQRKGQLAVKLATADAGFYNKRIVNAAHRLVVTKDTPTSTRLLTGLPVPVDDKDNVGAVLAKDAGSFKAGTTITSSMLEKLKDAEVDEIVVHSPMTEVSEDGGISKLAAGRRTKPKFHDIGDNIGIPSAQAIGERLSQGALSAKHSGGVSDRVKRSGFEYLNRLIEAPEHFPEAGPLSEEDGMVQEIKPAPQGGTYVKVGERNYYLNPILKPAIKVGDNLESGDDLSDGIPHPRDLVRLRGIGEARRVFTNLFKEALDESGAKAHRRNVETVVAGLLNWARVTNPDGYGDAIYDDIVPYNRLMSQYKPRQTASEGEVQKSLGKYLEEPALHYTPGTRITKKVVEKLRKHGIDKAFVHTEPPDFVPEMVRGINAVSNDPDWMTRQSGFYTSAAFTKSLHRGLGSQKGSTSYVPAVADPATLGDKLTTMGKYGAVTRLLAAGFRRKA